MIIKVTLNGTNENPWYSYGLTQNPLPQIAEYEYTNHMLNLQKLGGDPIPQDNPEAYIRKVLAGWSEEFIALCVKNYKPNEYVTFHVKAP